MATAVTNIAKAIATIQGEAVFNFNEVNVMLPLITSAQAPQGAGNVNFPIYNNPAVSDVDGSQNTAGTSFPVTADSQTCTPVRKGIHTTLSDEASIGGPGVVGSIGQVLGNGVAQKFDKDACALFDSFTQTNDVDANSALTLAMFFSAMAKIKADGAPAPYSFVSNAGGIYGANGLRSLLVTTANDSGIPYSTAGDEFMSTGFVTQVGLCNVFNSEGCTIDGTDVEAGMFGKSAIVCGIGAQGLLRVEEEREATKGAWNIVASGFYDVKIGQADHGSMVKYLKD
tara:strand:+ start:250 stop:1101 length:852 start_codon:yes stop_codon:yes gene_type:complete